MLRRLLIMVVCVGVLALASYRISRQRLPHLEESDGERPVGVYHLHSEASHDSNVQLEEIVAAAKENDLDFVIVTDHNAQMAEPVQIDGITILSYSELSTSFGHMVQLGARSVPKNGERKGHYVLRTVRAAGGFPILAHPSDPRRPWTGPIARAAGLEIANTAAAAKRLAGPIFVGLLPALLVYRIRPELALSQLYDRDNKALRRWDGESNPRFVGLCGTDAHGRISVALNLRTWNMVLLRPLPTDPAARPAAILQQLIEGRFHCVAGLLAHDPNFHFGAIDVDGAFHPTGVTLPLFETDTLMVRGPSADVDDVQLVLFKNGEAVARTRETTLVYAEPGAGTYRVEVRAPMPHPLFGSRHVPVLYSNRIRIKGAETLTPQLPVPEPSAAAPNAGPGGLK